MCFQQQLDSERLDEAINVMRSHAESHVGGMPQYYGQQTMPPPPLHVMVRTQPLTLSC